MNKFREAKAVNPRFQEKEYFCIENKNKIVCFKSRNPTGIYKEHKII